MLDLKNFFLNIFTKIYLIASLNPNQIVKKEIFQIYSAMAMYSEDGYSLCLRILDNIKVSFF